MDRAVHGSNGSYENHGKVKTHYSRALLLLLLLAPLPAPAHEAGQPTTGDPSLAIFAGVGVKSLSADRPYPLSRLPGVLEAGSPRDDGRKGGLDYAEIGLDWRFSADTHGLINLTQHGSGGEKPKIELLWLTTRQALGGSSIELQAGRQYAPLGFENLIHSHQRDFGVAPLAMRAAVNEVWAADGVRVQWQQSGLEIGAGGWNNQGFPGTPTPGINLTTSHIGWGNGAWKLAADYAHLTTKGRALITTGLQGGHTHTAPTCTVVSKNRVCLAAGVDVGVLAARWQPENSGWRAAAELWSKRERGSLDSSYGLIAYKGLVSAGWLDVGYQFTPTLRTTARIERLQARHWLSGTNAQLVANQVALAGASRPLSAVGLTTGWNFFKGHELFAEWHRDMSESQANNLWLLRYQLHLGQELLPK